jgi:carbon monoxide dehydrogenase subunit G
MTRFQGEEIIDAPVEKVWEFISDPNKIGGCAPGVKKLEVTDEDHFNAEVKVGLGFLKGTVKVRYEALEKKPPEKLVLKMSGSGIGSQIDIKATVELKPENGRTKLAWFADVTVSGMLAGLGGRYINDATYKNVSELFKCVKETLKQ